MTEEISIENMFELSHEVGKLAEAQNKIAEELAILNRSLALYFEL